MTRATGQSAIDQLTTDSTIPDEVCRQLDEISANQRTGTLELNCKDGRVLSYRFIPARIRMDNEARRR